MKRAFTLIELLISATIFILIVGAVLGFFISSLRVQRRDLASQELLDQAGFALDFISRKARMSRKELNCNKILDTNSCKRKENIPYCLTGAGYGCNYELTRENNGIKFIDYSGVCQEFYLDVEESRLKKGECYLADGSCQQSNKGLPEGANWEDNWTFSYLTSSSLEVNNFKIEIVGGCQCQEGGIECINNYDLKDNFQPRAIFRLGVRKAGGGSKDRQELMLQTVVSQRNRDVVIVK